MTKLLSNADNVSYVANILGDSDTELMSVEIVQAVADAADTDPTDVKPLFETLDPDALDALFASASGDVIVEFELAGYRVRAGEQIAVEELNE